MLLDASSAAGLLEMCHSRANDLFEAHIAGAVRHWTSLAESVCVIRSLQLAGWINACFRGAQMKTEMNAWPGPAPA